jgi:hypothetical protein
MLDCRVCNRFAARYVEVQRKRVRSAALVFSVSVDCVVHRATATVQA